MTFKEWEGRAFDRFSGTITNPRFSGPFVKHLLADWKAEREKLIGAAQALIDYVHNKYPGEELRCPYMKALEAALVEVKEKI